MQLLFSLIKAIVLCRSRRGCSSRILKSLIIVAGTVSVKVTKTVAVSVTITVTVALSVTITVTVTVTVSEQ